jgi:histidyl-tRNA synthetase
MYKQNPKDRAQFNVADSDQIPFVAILAPEETKAGTVRIKQQLGKEAVEAGEAGDKRGELVKVDEVVAYLQQKLRGL